MQLHIQKEHLETLPQQQICHSGFFLREPVMVPKHYSENSEFVLNYRYMIMISNAQRVKNGN